MAKNDELLAQLKRLSSMMQKHRKAAAKCRQKGLDSKTGRWKDPFKKDEYIRHLQLADELFEKWKQVQDLLSL